jgi:hypothetical protein
VASSTALETVASIRVWEVVVGVDAIVRDWQARPIRRSFGDCGRGSAASSEIDRDDKKHAENACAGARHSTFRQIACENGRSEHVRTAVRSRLWIARMGNSPYATV